ncbi:CinA family protein [Bifidobacterium simiarum]|uniref:Damage-inducible protein CinA n=1 Tax=Bifidobacterium simiarum TaxID=2045441 RepID=A0A2M9HEM5_9BIFI|nr:CinA family protein [Bifidobacterium simiarum]PJM75237.1 damage-inducible protein CinA [Bifidobacterium simiarum]
MIGTDAPRRADKDGCAGEDGRADDRQQIRDGLAESVLGICLDRHWFIAASESLTGGLLADAFVRIPGASRVFLGSAVTYDINAKAAILGVDAALLRREGAVHPQVACQMAEATARLYDTHDDLRHRVVGLSTTGVAGPGPDGDKPAGLVYVGISLPEDRSSEGDPIEEHDAARTTHVSELHLRGDRETVRRNTVEAVLRELSELLVRSDSRV